MSEHYSEFGFYVCRKCLKPGDSVNLFSILDGPGRAKVFEDVTDILFHTEDENNDVLICKDCIDEVYGAFEFRLSVWNAEVKYFKPLREKALAAPNPHDYKNNFIVCRVCLTTDALTKTIFKKNGLNGMEYVEMLFHLTDLNITGDYGHFSGLICIGCIDKLERSFRIREAVRNAESSHFGPCRVSKWSSKDKEASKNREAPRKPRKSGTQPEKPKNTNNKYFDGTKPIKHDSNKTDKENRQFECKHEGCSKSYKSKCALNAHIRAVHSDKQHPCHCGLVFSCKSYLSSHMKRVHRNA